MNICMYEFIFLLLHNHCNYPFQVSSFFLLLHNHHNYPFHIQQKGHGEYFKNSIYSTPDKLRQKGLYLSFAKGNFQPTPLPAFSL